MSSTPANIPAVPALGVGPARPPRSEAARVILETFGQVGEFLGGIWVGLIAFMAVFAPLIANSFPYLVKVKGQGWTSPLLKHLTAADVSLLLAVVAGGVVFFAGRHKSFNRRLLIFAGVMAAVVVLSLWLVRPSAQVIYDEYRELATQGKLEHVLWAPLRYSPSDHLGDQIDPNEPNPRAPSRSHWLGTDIYGSDVASRMIHACRIAMAVGFISTGIAVVLGIILGGLMGYFSRWVDLLGMRLVEIFDAIPTLFLILSIIAFWGQGSGTLLLIMVVIGITSFSGYAVFIRAEFLKLRQQDFVQAARAAGLPLWSVLFRHMLPNGVTPVLVSASFGIAGAINVENVLSFLGIGLIEEPSWGGLLKQATEGGFRWWLATYPGLALTLTMFAFVLIGEAMRDVIDPYTRSKQV